MQVSGIVNPPSNLSIADGQQPIALQGKAAELIVAELHAKYYTTAYRGTSYIGSAAGAGVVPPIYTTTAQVFGIWNRAGNTRNAVLQTLDIGVAVFAAAVVGNLCLSQSLNAGSALATGGISAFTAGTPSTGVVGSQAANTVSFAPGTATTLATTFLMSLNYSFFTTAITTPAGGSAHYDFEGGVIVPPNVAIWLASAPAAQTATFNPTLRWEEPPL